jgi:streptomycin 6-kinase
MLAQSKELAHPLPQQVVGAAAETIRVLGLDETATLLHGDLHFANVLRSDREPWLAIDPKGYAGTAAFDAATIVRDRPEELFAAADLRKALLRRIEIFSEAAEVDRELAVRATQARMVSSAFWERLHGQPRMGIEAADRISTVLV